jgi:excisionase family DNA binding protein
MAKPTQNSTGDAPRRLDDPQAAGVTVVHHNHGPPALYTSEEAAAILRVKRSWLERQAARRKIPFTMLGGAYRFTAAHLAEIVLMHEESPAPRNNAPGRGGTARVHKHAPALETVPLRPRPRGGPGRAA